MRRKTLSNIHVKKSKHVVAITRDMIFKKEIVSVNKNGVPKTKLTVNVDYWKNLGESVNVVLDEVHTLMNPRRSMSKSSVVILDWLSLIRRVLGNSESGYGELVLITQLHNRIDLIAREMARQVRYHRCHYRKTCKKCGLSLPEHNDMPIHIHVCPSCGTMMKKHKHRIEVWVFQDMSSYMNWDLYAADSYFRHYMVNDIEDYFSFYDTLQWDNLISETDD